MDINTFLEKTSGDWFSQRTTYNLSQDNVDNSKANITINLLSSDDNSQVEQFCEKYNLNLDLSLGMMTSNWDNSPDWGKPKQQGNSLMLIFADENNHNQGKILRVLSDDKALMGKYILAEDESLTLMIEENNQSMEERIYFASDNLRLRNTIVKNNGEVTQTCFYSEIRRIVNN
ncbi:phycobiliprotein lyase [Geminocystis sp.]|uniref:phycobiliprotein lyase n=1 Tax=Geminocystis sp. TaxID=2664100 RepID=UPI003594857A